MGAETYSFEPHGPWLKRRGVAWVVCGGCGLISLNNDLTKWAIAKGCNNRLHPDHARMCRELPNG